MPICMECNYKFQFVRRGVENAAPYNNLSQSHVPLIGHFS